MLEKFGRSPWGSSPSVMEEVAQAVLDTVALQLGVRATVRVLEALLGAPPVDVADGVAGRGVFLPRDVKAGDLVLVDRAAVVAVFARSRKRVCARCSFVAPRPLTLGCAACGVHFCSPACAARGSRPRGGHFCAALSRLGGFSLSHGRRGAKKLGKKDHESTHGSFFALSTSRVIPFGFF